MAERIVAQLRSAAGPVAEVLREEIHSWPLESFGRLPKDASSYLVGWKMLEV